MSIINAYRVPPMQEFKARRELRNAGCKAFLPTERQAKRKAPIARGYIFADRKPAEAKHVRAPVGACPRVQVIRLYPRRDRGHEPAAPIWAIGDRVEIKVGQYASMTGMLLFKRGRRQWIVDVAGKPICAQTQSLIRIDPG